MDQREGDVDRLGRVSSSGLGAGCRLRFIIEAEGVAHEIVLVDQEVAGRSADGAGWEADCQDRGAPVRRRSAVVPG